MNDQLLTFSFSKARLRGALVQTSQSFQNLTEQHGDQAQYPLFIKNLLGEMTVLVLMMASNLKLTGTMSLQLRGKGYLYSLLSDVTLNTTPTLTIRGLARRADQPQPNSLDLRDWVGANATLAITLQPDQGQPYQGFIPLEHPRLSQCVEEYYGRSEQIPTKFWTQLDDNHCAGFMLQFMPGAQQPEALEGDFEENSIDLEIGSMLANTLKPNELIETEPKTLLFRLFHEYEVLVHIERNIEYGCKCDSRMENALLSLGQAELENLAQEQPTIEMTCQMCGRLREFQSQQILKKYMEHQNQ